MLVQDGMHHELLANRVAGELPGELVAPALLVFPVGRSDDFVVAFPELSVVLDDGG